MRYPLQRLLGAAVLTLSVAFVSACGSNDVQAGDGSADDPAEVTGTLRVLTPSFPASSEGQDAFQRVVDAFHEDYPNVEVEPDFATFDNLNEKISTSIAGGMPYDVLVTGIGWVQPFASRNAFVNLSEFGVTEEALGELANPALIPAATYQGDVYAVPLIAGAKPLAYSQRAFEEAGLDPDVPPSSWGEVREYAEQLTVRDDAGGITRAGFDFWAAPSEYRQDFVTFLGSLGVSLFDDQGNPQFDGPEGVRALEFMGELINDAEVVEFGQVSGTGEPMLYTGQAAMGFVGGYMDCSEDALGPEFCDDLAFFNVAEDATAMFSGGQLASVGATSDMPEVAYAFIEKLAAPEAQADMAALNFAVPAAKDAGDAEIVQSNPASTFTYENLDVVVFEGGSDNWLDLRDVFNAELDKALLGSASAEGVLSDLASQAAQ
jgi:multiple sugar transport system substrate-binding protein